ncbi:MAG: NAD(P)H-dependent oxidoreductase [Saccharofermentans sp.]|nr:NAD(P)H-dependent oxidoreductase [Saccharofermentans sp.]
MHVLIINGSPRIKAHSNTDKIIDKFGEGLKETGGTYEQYEVSDRKQWDAIRDAFAKAENILIAIPLYVENIPGLLLEFLESVPSRRGDANIAYILQGGFAEGAQLRCGEEYLKILTKQLGCNYKGTLVKGDNFSIRFFEGEKRDKVTGPYKKMGVIFGKNGDFNAEECKKFTGPEIFPAYIRLLIGTIFKTVAKKGFAQIAKGWGCTTPLDYRPY